MSERVFFIPEARRSAVNEKLDEAGYGDDTFSVKLTDKEGAVWYACSVAVENEGFEPGELIEEIRQVLLEGDFKEWTQEFDKAIAVLGFTEVNAI